jgi:hypothetical protein
MERRDDAHGIDPTRSGRKAHDPGEPRDDVRLDLGETGGRGEDTDVAIRRVRDEVRDGALQQAAPRNVSQIAGTGSAETRRDHAVEEQGEKRFDGLPSLRRFSRSPRATAAVSGNAEDIGECARRTRAAVMAESTSAWKESGRARAVLPGGVSACGDLTVGSGRAGERENPD